MKMAIEQYEKHSHTLSEGAPGPRRQNQMLLTSVFMPVLVPLIAIPLLVLPSSGVGPCVLALLQDNYKIVSH